MGLALKCLEHVTAFGCVVAAYSVGSLDPGLTALGVVSGAAIIARFKEHCAKHGLDEPELLSKMQMVVLRDWDTVDQTQADRDAIVEADAAMRKHLLDCMLTREELAGSSVSTEHYPKRAARLVTDRMAESYKAFSAPTDPAHEVSVQRRFALTVIENALKAAMDEATYAARLKLDLLIAGNAAHAVTHELLAQVLTLVGQTSLPEHAIREAVARFIVLQPHAGTNEIVSAIGNFERDYRALEAQVAAITILDNHVQSIKVKAEEALAAGDLDSARICYGDAKLAARDKASEPVRTAAELASAEASVHLLALDWMAADKAWTEAELMLAPFDMVASSELAHKSAQKLFDFGDRHAEIGPLDASAMRWELLGKAAEQLGEKKGAALYKDCAGVALRKRAERSSGELAHELFAKSALFHEAACKANHRIETPVEWSLAQHNLGTCLDFWAKLLDGQKGRNLLIKAISAFRECLRARPKKTMLLERLKTQNNLGNALWELGERTPGDAGIKLLRQAIATHRTVLRSRKRMDHAGFWAQSKSNIGIATYSLGKRLSGVESKYCLENAVANFRSALGARDETKNPVLWALTQSNLALALIDFAKKSDDRIAVRSLTDAIAACNFALSVRTESAMPSHWAKNAVQLWACKLGTRQKIVWREAKRTIRKSYNRL